MIVSTVSQALLWAVLGLGIFVTFRILNFPDMTTEGLSRLEERLLLPY